MAAISYRAHPKICAPRCGICNAGVATLPTYRWLKPVSIDHPSFARSTIDVIALRQHRVPRIVSSFIDLLARTLGATQASDDCAWRSPFPSRSILRLLLQFAQRGSAYLALPTIRSFNDTSPV